MAVSTTVPVGTGYVGDFAGSTELRIREDARVDWSEDMYSPDRFGAGQGGNLFEANQIVSAARCAQAGRSSDPLAWWNST